MTAAVVPLLVRIAARRPASWLAAGSAAASCLALTTVPAGGPAVAAAVACGGWAGVAAAGLAPRGLVPGVAAVDALASWTRALWPVAAAAAAGVGAAVAGGAGLEMAAASILGTLVATVLSAGAARRGAPAADAASLAAAASTASAAACLLATEAWPALATAAGAAAVVLAVAWIAWRTGCGLPGPADGEVRPARTPFAEIGIGRGGLRRILAALAMASSLVGLAAWYFLVPEAAASGGPFVIGWFTALAVPAALIGPPTGDGWRRLAATAPVTAGRRFAGWIRPTGPRWAGAVAVGHAVLLGWPPLVAGLLHAAEASGGPAAVAQSGPWLAVGALAMAAAGLIGLAWAASAVPVRRETALAVAAGLVAVATVWAVAQMPRPRGLPKIPGQTGVEKMARLTR
ncbi:MAG: hypothetical protein ACKONH_10200 [Planctomycetia bacterium]